MFAKGARFPPEKPSDIPGPGFYKLPEESRLESYKKGAFLEKTDRFGSEKGSDVPGPGAYDVGPRDSNPRLGPPKNPKSDQGLIHLQQEIEALKSQNTRLLKEHQQTVRDFQDKVTHNESTIRSLVKDNVALQSQLSSEQKAHRSGCQREVALRAALGKAEASTKGDGERASKLAGLQRKLQDLEKIHSDDKKRHEAEVVQLKCELDTSRKLFREQNEMAAQLRKHQETSEQQTKDLKKAIVADQAEIKELRMKVQNSTQAKGQLVTCHNEVEGLRKCLQNLEVKHKTELQSQNLKLLHQEKCLASECRRRETLERQVTEADQGAKMAKDRIRSLQMELDALTRSFEEVQTSTTEERQHLIDIRASLGRVAEAYGHLAASSVSLDLHRQSELRCASLRLRNIRLERRLADREALVEQLTAYCRQTSEENSLLAKHLRELEDDQRTLLSRNYLNDATQLEDASLIYSLFDAWHCASHQHESISQDSLHFAEAMGSFYQAHCDDLLIAYAMAHREIEEQSVVAKRLVDHCTVLQTEGDALRLNNSTVKEELAQKCIQIAEGLTREEMLNKRLETHQREFKKVEDMLERERQTGDRLVRASHQSKKNEERLHLEVDELVDNLADLTRYKEAHADLLAEVVELIQRNELAEAEAERLGKFNAEILGHTNPNQKIFYVDRIRRELADVKHQLLKSTRDRNDLAADNAALYHEVAAYKSIAVPMEQMPRSTRVRIERPPLVTRSINELTSNIAFEITPPPEEPIDTAPMTMDEIT